MNAAAVKDTEQFLFYHWKQMTHLAKGQNDFWKRESSCKML